ncbi:hypothetical protein DIT71_09630 [Marinobacter vulgaris]|uniref:PRC-barrel domain-containing protein n=1 Tax=Marinobacter vulgaris TaxID=1928331 RepID=A0A2V3ZK66_9GAMM|nr:PRC-barrel domain-containing protein [Marinobacter vulgaris]PXX90788.1 hypothetical protein DIT71_09630 [Marinobacter vulgaris]TSJ70235.1 PRC-barrel domain containing protein [Marinobacter vulgaris]
MKKLHSLAFYALVTPAITLGSGAVLAAQAGSENNDLGEQSMGQDAKQQQQGNQDSMKSNARTTQTDQKTRDQSDMQNKGYLDSVPADGARASDLISAEIKTTDDENVGSVTDLIIDKNGKVVAVVVGVGGFLGMAEKDVAIGWDEVTMSRDSDELQLQIDMTRDDLQAAPSYKQLDD